MLLLQCLRASPLLLGPGAVCQKSSFACFLSAICLRQRALFFILLAGQLQSDATGLQMALIVENLPDIISSTRFVNQAAEKRSR